MCVTVNCSKAEEKLLNLTLNNPQIQGQFVERIGEYIEQLQIELGDDKGFLDLRIAELRGEIESEQGQSGQNLTYKEEIIKPYKKTHILISFEPNILIKISGHLEAIIRETGVEYEQCSN